MAQSTVDKAKNAVQELRLNVAYFYEDQESRNLLQAEETSRSLGEEDYDYYMRNERVYECVLGRRVCRIARSSMLALSLFCTIAVAVLIVTIILLFTFLSLTTTNEIPEDVSNEDVIGVINWLHYPLGDIALRRFNHTKH